MKKLLTTTCGAAFVLALTLAGARAQIYTNALDDKTGWDGLGGSPAKFDSTWSTNNTVVAPGSTGSWWVAANFTNGNYVDIYTQGSFGVWDFSTNTFSIWLYSSVTNAPLLWQLRNATLTDTVTFEVAVINTATNEWQLHTYNPSQFSGNVANLTNIYWMQLRFAGDNLGGGSADFYVDQMNIVPEPSAAALLALGAAGVGALAWRKRRRALS